MTSARSITTSANPPRAVFVDLPLGHTTGPPNDAATQTSILDRAFEAAATMTPPSPGEPGRIVDLPLQWRHDEWKANPLSWSRRREDQGTSGNDAGDTRTTRLAEPQWQSDADRAAFEAEGTS